MSRQKTPTPSAEATDDTIHVEGDLSLERVFPEAEADLVRTLAQAARAGGHVDLQRALQSGLQNLGTLALALESYPPLKEDAILVGRFRSSETLIKVLVDAGDHGLEWVLPTKAVLSRTFGIAKVNFFTSLEYVLGTMEGAEAASFHDRIALAVEEAVYTRLAEELYASFVTSRTTAREVKAQAAHHLIEMWDGRTGLVTTRFCPLLRSAWAARTRAPRVFGTLMGTTEILQLLFQDCDEKFVSFFSRHREDSEQRQAFEEFVFDLPFENLERVRQRMLEEGKDCVGPREVEQYLGFGSGRLRPRVGDAKGLYVSFRRRRVKAQYRTSMGIPGPKRTAEAYILAALLEEEAEREAT